MDVVSLFLFIFLVFYFIFVHEFIHWVVLRLLGYDGKLVFGFRKKINFIFIGVKPLGVHENIVSARDVVLVDYMPLLFGWLWFIPFSVFNGFNVFSVCLGFFIWFSCSGADIYNIFQIYYWWLKPFRVRRVCYG